MDWYNAESTVMPLDEDTTSSRVYNYVRQNITSREEDDVTWYSYQERKIPKDQWSLYKAQEQQSADIDYLLMITEDL